MNRRKVAKNVKEDSVFDIVRNFLFFNIVRKQSKSSKNEQKTSLLVEMPVVIHSQNSAWHRLEAFRMNRPGSKWRWPVASG